MGRHTQFDFGLKEMSSEIGLAESGIFQYISLQGGDAEICN
jgi:hypothetical protein